MMVASLSVLVGFFTRLSRGGGTSGGHISTSGGATGASGIELSRAGRAINVDISTTVWVDDDAWQAKSHPTRSVEDGLESYDKKPNVPFWSQMEPQTVDKYAGVWKQLLGFLWRTQYWDDADRPPYELTEAQADCFDELDEFLVLHAHTCHDHALRLVPEVHGSPQCFRGDLVYSLWWTQE